MSAVTTTKNGVWSDGTVFSTGTQPTTSDTLTISHTVTVDGTYTFGTDPFSAALGATIAAGTVLTIASGGTLKASRSANSDLTIRGIVQIASGGALDYGTNGEGSTANDKIPSGVTAKLTMATAGTTIRGKYGVYCLTGGIARIAGVERTRNAKLTSAITATDGTINVDSATGWAVADVIVIATTSGTASQYEVFKIRSITGTAVTLGTFADHTVAATAAYAHAINGPVGNFTSNVVFTAASTLGWWFRNDITSTDVSYGKNFMDVVFEHCSQPSTATPYSSLPSWIGFNLTTSNSTSYGTGVVYADLKRVAFWQTLTIPFSIFGNSLGGTIMNPRDICIYNPFVSGSSGTAIGQIVVTVERLNYYGEYTANQNFVGFGAGGKPKFKDCYIVGSRGYNILTGQTIAGEFEGCYIGCSVNAVNIAGNDFTFRDCVFGDATGSIGTPTITSSVLRPTNLLNLNFNFIDCYFQTGLDIFYLAEISPRYNVITSETAVINKEAVTTAQEVYTPMAILYRDNSTFYRGQSALRMMPVTAGWGFKTIKILALNGVASKVIGYMRYNTAYATTNKPKVTVSGLGITPVSYQATVGVDTWEKYELDFTQNSGADGELELTFEGNSASLTTGACWFDGVPFAPFITAVRHYGYIFNPTSATRTADPVTVKTETQANAVTGYSINDGTETLTISGTITSRDLYDAIKADRCDSANLTEPDFFRSTDGVNFTCDYDVDFTSSGVLTGTGTLNLGTKTATIASGGGSSLIITDVSGTYVGISITGMTAVSRVQLYNLDTSTELYNAVVVGTSLALPYTYTTDVNLRVRIMYVSASSANIFYDQNWVITNTGLSIAITPETDTVYVDNGVNGSTVTTITIDDANLLVEVDTGTITWADIYAYETYWLGTQAGIRDEGRFILAVDTANYIIYDFKVKNVSSPTAPLVITGGWGRDSVTGTSIEIVDTTGGTVFNAPDHVVSYAVGSGLDAAQDAKLTAINSNMTIVNNGVKKASILVPHSQDTV